MACILINGEVQSTFTIKDLENAIKDILSRDDNQMIVSPEGVIGYISRKEYAEQCFPKLIVTSQVQEDIEKEIINNLHSYKPFSKCLSNG